MTSAALPAASTAASSTGRTGRLLSTGLLVLALLALAATIGLLASGLRLRIEQTGSMAPALQPGDLVLVRETPAAAVGPADIVGVRGADGRVIVHRVLRIDASPSTLSFTTRGDANPTAEQWTVPRTESLVRVEGRLPRLGRVVAGARTPLGAAIFGVAALALSAAALRTIWRRS